MQLAREVDIPAVKKADRVVIEEGGSPSGDGKRVTLDDAPGIEVLSRGLAPTVVLPSGGKLAATLSFYRGETLLRKIWVYQGGEWGFDRPGTDWTTGLSPELWKAVQARLR